MTRLDNTRQKLQFYGFSPRDITEFIANLGEAKASAQASFLRANALQLKSQGVTAVLLMELLREDFFFEYRHDVDELVDVAGLYKLDPNIRRMSLYRNAGITAGELSVIGPEKLPDESLEMMAFLR